LSGLISDARFDKGEIIFQKPTSGSPDIKAQTGATRDTTTFRPVFRVGQNAGTKAYAIESLVSVSDTCAADCASKAKSYGLELRVPDEIPKPAVLDEVELICVSGNCNSFALISGPTLSEDKSKASVKFRAWGERSTWQLAAKVFVTSTPSTSTATTFDPVRNELDSVETASLSAFDLLPFASPSTHTDTTTIAALESDDPKIRRPARDRLARLLASSPPNLISADLKKVPTGSYRYQLGMMSALGKISDGWVPPDPLSFSIVSDLASNATERSLLQEAKRAFSNIRLYTYYEASQVDSSATAGRLRPVTVASPPFPPASALKRNTVLQAASAVYLRSAPKSDQNVISVLRPNACVRMIDVERVVEGAGAWFKVAPSECGSKGQASAKR